MSSLVDACHSQDFLFDCMHFLHFLSWQVFSVFCRSIGVTSIRSVRVAHGLCIIALVHCFLSLFSHTPHPHPFSCLPISLLFSPFPYTPPPFHCFPPHPSQAIWGEAAKGPAGACPAEAGVCQPGVSSPEPTCLWETEGHYGYVYSWITVCHILNLHVIE